MWELTIRKVRNGYVLTSPPEDEGLGETIEVIEETDEEEGDRNAALSLLWYVAEHFALPRKKLVISVATPLVIPEEDA